MRAECLHVAVAAKVEPSSPSALVFQNGKARFASEAVETEIPMPGDDLFERQRAGAVGHAQPPGLARRWTSPVGIASPTNALLPPSPPLVGLRNTPAFTALQHPSGPASANRSTVANRVAWGPPF